MSQAIKVTNNNSSSFQALIQSSYRLCLSQAKNQNHKRHCRRDLSHYEQYIKEYKKQFVQKGYDICMDNLGSGSYQSRKKNRNQCVQFYMKSFNVLEENCKDKLNSLINKLDYVQL